MFDLCVYLYNLAICLACVSTDPFMARPISLAWYTLAICLACTSTNPIWLDLFVWLVCLLVHFGYSFGFVFVVNDDLAAHAERDDVDHSTTDQVVAHVLLVGASPVHAQRLLQMTEKTDTVLPPNNNHPKCRQNTVVSLL